MRFGHPFHPLRNKKIEDPPERESGEAKMKSFLKRKILTENEAVSYTHLDVYKRQLRVRQRHPGRG